MDVQASVAGFTTHLGYTVCQRAGLARPLGSRCDSPSQTYALRVRCRVAGDDAPTSEWIVHRRYREFRALHHAVRSRRSSAMERGSRRLHQLGNLVEGGARILPSLPAKRILGSKSETFVRNRGNKLDQYLQQLLARVPAQTSVPASHVAPRLCPRAAR